MIWLLFAILTACVILGVTRSLYRGSSKDNASESEIEAYKAQLSELDRDEERGALGKEEAQQTRAEVSRRLLRASRQGAATPATRAGSGGGLAFASVAAVLALGTIGTYVYYGAPGLPDQPLEARLSVPLGEQSADVQVANMERRLRQNPSDVAGWSALATIYFRAGLFEKAADTYRKAINAGARNEGILIGLAESLTFANDGIVPEEAVQALDMALAVNPNSMRGRFWRGLLAEQNGKKAAAEKIYRDLLASAQIPSSLKKVVTQRLQALAAPSGDDSAETAAADTPEERAEEHKMMSGMVEKLAARLKQDKSDLDGWLMLIRSYAVLKDADKAKAAMASARQQFASDEKALAQIDAITNELSFAFTDASAAPQKDKEAAAQQAPAAPPFGGEQGAIIRGMVEKLASRLKENGADLQGWLKLIRSYAVLKETDKAEAAAATARQEFASDAKAIEEIDALTQGLGLASPTVTGGPPKS